MQPTIDCADFTEWAPSLGDGSVDLVLIDPPYGISKETGFQSCRSTPGTLDKFRVSMDFGAWDTEDNAARLVTAAVKEAYRALRKGGTLICFYDVWKTSFLAAEMSAAGFVQRRMINWVKTNPVPINSRCTYLSNAIEAAVMCVKGGSSTFNSKFDNGIYEFPSATANRIHPTQKPTALFEALIEKHSNEGDLVVDFFSGSGTTARACVKTNRIFKGCEIDEKYCELANQSLQHSQQGDLI